MKIAPINGLSEHKPAVVLRTFNSMVRLSTTFESIELSHRFVSFIAANDLVKKMLNSAEYSIVEL